MNFITQIAILFVYFTAWYLFTSYIKNAGYIDVGWGIGFVVLSIYNLIVQPTISGALFVLLVAAWGLRLSFHIFKRNYKKKEDYRYANFRKEWGSSFYLRAYFQLFLFQGLLMFLISISFTYGQLSQQPANLPLLILGLLVYSAGWLIETIADKQLKDHIAAQTKPSLCRSGLWKYSRHPNYFGEAVIWWGIYVVSLAYGAPVWTIMSPMTITYLLRFVSGVPMLEKRMAKYEEFEDYKKKTSVFIPWFTQEDKK